jgi:uncharacterized protein YcgI (DUF1989 family)
MAILRKSILMNGEYGLSEKGKGFGHEFHDLAVFMADGHWHIMHSPEPLSWKDRSLNTVQVRDETFHDCFGGACRIEH